MAYRAAVVGGSGYTGAELLRLLAAHPDIEVAHVTAESNAGARLADLYPSLAPVYGDRAYAPLDAADLRGLDLVFCALPHGASQALLPGLVDDVAHIVDLGADFRLPADVYARVLGQRMSDVTGQPVEWAQSWYRGDRYKFVTRLRRTPNQ